MLHAPAAVGGHPPGLAAAERTLGLDSTVLTVDQPPYGYAVDRVLAPPGTSTAVRELRRWRTVAEARGFDVVHFNFGSSLAPGYYGTAGRGGLYRLYSRLFEQRDLRLLRGRPVFVTFQGDDVRPSGDAEQDGLKRRRAERFARAADGLYVLNPDLLEQVPSGEFLPYASVDPREWTATPPVDAGALRVVHAPSDRGRKGTSEVLSAVEQLRTEGVEIELELVEGKPRAEARKAYERADVLVDQLVVGWYGGVAVEAMALAKPVVARLDPSALARVPARMRDELPIVHADATTLPEVLRRLATEGRSGLGDLGRRSREFVEHWHDPLAIAERVAADYERALARRRTGSAD